MYTEEERAKWRERVARWRNGELVYDAGRIVEKSDNTSVQRLEPVLPIQRNFIAEAQRKHAAEAVGPDTRSSYQRNRDQEAARQAFVQYLQQKDALKQAKGGQQLLETIGLGLDAYTLGSVGSLLTKGLLYAAKKGVQSVANKLVRSNASNILSTRFKLSPEALINIPIQKALPASISEYPPEFYYTGRIPKRTLDLQELQLQNKGALIIKDIQEDPSNYTFLEIDNAFKEYRGITKNSNTVPIRLPSSNNVILMGGQTFREHLKNNINPVLRHDGFKGVPLDASPEEAMQYVREKYRELNTFARGIADPRDLHQHGLYNKVYSKLEKKLQRPPNHDEIMDYMAVTPNRGITGHGAIGRESGEYTLYTSNGMDQSVGYALRGDNPSKINPQMRAVYELLIPEQMPNKNTYDTRFSPIGNYILNNRFALLSRDKRIEKDLYSEYGLPYLLATGKSLPMYSIDYDEGLRKYFGVNRKDLLGIFFDSVNDRSEQINKLLLSLNSTFRLPYIRFSTMRKHPQIVEKQTRLQNIIDKELGKWRASSMLYPEDAAPFLLEQAINSIKNKVKNFNTGYKPKKFNPTVQKTENLLKQDLENAIGKTPVGGYLKHKEAHNVFTTEGYNKRLTVNDKRYLHPTGSRDKDASLLHYVFYNNTGEPMLDIKRRVPFEEWKNYRNYGSSHWGSYFPGYSRRMSSLIPPIISAVFYKNYKNEAQSQHNRSK